MRSFRARLTLWNALVIAAVLGAFSLGTIYVNQAKLAADIDRQLADQAAQPGPPDGRGPGGPFRPGGPQPPAATNGDGRGQDDLPPRFADPSAIRFADVRRPRRFDDLGKPLGPMRDPAFDETAVQKALRGESSYSDGEFDGEPIRIYTMPLRQGPNRGGVIQVARQVGSLSELRASQIWTLLLFLPVAVLAAAVGAFFLTSKATKPLARMKLDANAITERDLSKRLAIEGHDEFAELGETLNRMISRLEDSFEEQKAAYEKLEQAHENQKRFTADASHELRTPLTRLQLATSSALEASATPEERSRALKVADEAAKSMSRLVQELLVLARADAGQLTIHRERLDLRVIATDLLESLPPDPRIRTAIQSTPVTVMGDADHLARVLSNLIDNALRYTPPDGAVTVSVRRQGSEAVMGVVDTGAGIAPEHLPHVSERFYRADASRSRRDGGCGLGLAICKTIAEAHGGSTEIESDLGRGTTVTVRLPLTP